MPRYAIKTSWDDTYLFDADLSQASAPIKTIAEDGHERSTPFQTADAGHDEDEAALLLMRWWGRGLWLSPDAKTSEREDGEPLYDGMTENEYIRSMITVESVEDDDD